MRLIIMNFVTGGHRSWTGLTYVISLFGRDLLRYIISPRTGSAAEDVERS